MKAYHLLRNILIALMTLPIGAAFAIDLDNSVTTGTLSDSIQINAASIVAPAKPSELNATTTSADNIQAVLLYALSHEGKAYRRGASSPEIGFDCSGFVRHVFDHAAGVALPHNASAISKIGSLVKKAELYLCISTEDILPLKVLPSRKKATTLLKAIPPYMVSRARFIPLPKLMPVACALMSSLIPLVKRS